MTRPPIGQGIFPLESSQIPTEVLAGLTLAALAIPEVMGYTKISGTPVVTGLYTLLIPVLLFALFGSSRHLVVGADSATAAILASALASTAISGSHEYVALSQALALMSAGFLVLARVIKLGFMADFLSRTVLIGFLTGVGIQVAMSQVSGMVANRYDFLIALLVIVVIIGSTKISHKIPGALIAVIAAIIVSRTIDFKAYGVSTVGLVPQGLPHFGLPDVQWSFVLIQKLLPTAFSMFVVILAQSAATSRAYAARYDESFNEDLDLVGLGLANAGAALSGAFVVNGSPTKTEMVDAAGGRTQFSQIVMGLVVLLFLFFFTGLLSKLPNAVLSAVVFLIGLKLIDIRGLFKVWRQRPLEFWVALATTIVVVLIGVEQGIVIAMVLSLIDHVRHSYRSQNVVLTKDKKGAWQLLPVTAPAQVEPGLMLYRFAHTIYYANAQQLFDQVIGLVGSASPPLRWFCIDASAIADIDFSAGETLLEIYGILKGKGVGLVWVNAIDLVKADLDSYGIAQLCGKDAFYENVNDCLEAYKKGSV